jgi:TRAP-type C4-dicarboxylate transport system permease small subunit
MITLRDNQLKGALQSALLAADRLTWGLGGVFQWICNICLLVMLGLTTVTIIGRPLGFSAYWIWPWTMVFFVWLSFFGFFAIFVRLKDVRINFFANHMGRFGHPFTRLVSDLSALAICGALMLQLPKVMATSRGFVDGAILPGGDELFRQALSVPLFISAALIIVSALIDLGKMMVGLPENVSEHHLGV